MGQQRAADGDPLLLAAREGARLAVEQGADVQQFYHRGQIACRSAVRSREPAAVQQVVADAEVGEEPAVLEDVADAAPVLRNEHAPLGVDQHLAVDRDPAARGPQEPADDVDQGGLARPRATEQRREARCGREACREPEVLADVIDVDFQAHATARRAPIRRASSSDPSKASIDSAIDISVRRRAPASPPGTWVKV